MPCAISKYTVPRQYILNFTDFDDFRPSVYPPLVITHHRWGKSSKLTFFLQFIFRPCFHFFLKQFSFSVSNPSGEKLFGTAYRVYSLGLRQCLWYPTCSQYGGKENGRRPCAIHFFCVYRNFCTVTALLYFRQKNFSLNGRWATLMIPHPWVGLGQSDT